MADLPGGLVPNGDPAVTSGVTAGVRSGGLVPGGIPTLEGGVKSGKLGGLIMTPYADGLSCMLVFRMRATDATLSKIVFWSSDVVDSAGVDYTGPGPLVGIVVQNVIGS